MSDEPKKRSRAWIGWMAALLIVYPLSIGPGSWLCARSDSRWATTVYHAIYFPIDLARMSIAVNDAFMRYIDLWLPD